MAEKNSEHHFENNPEFKGLKVNDGIEQPDSVSKDSVARFLKKNRKLIFLIPCPDWDGFEPMYSINEVLSVL